MDERLLIHRRTLLSLGGSAVALSALGLPLLAGAAPSVRYVITDRRHAASLAFARQWPAGTALEVTDGLTRLWRQALQPHWQSEAAGTVAGLTSREVWTCLAEQARSHGLLCTASARADALVSWVIA